MHARADSFTEMVVTEALELAAAEGIKAAAAYMHKWFVPLPVALRVLFKPGARRACDKGEN